MIRQQLYQPFFFFVIAIFHVFTTVSALCVADSGVRSENTHMVCFQCILSFIQDDTLVYKIYINQLNSHGLSVSKQTQSNISVNLE